MGRKIEALWDCAYCGAKGIGGLTKQCPTCGHPQDKDIHFYMPDHINEHVLDEKKAKEYGKGADWMCAYCQSLNRYYEESCHNCGAAREEQLGDYFSNKNIPPKNEVKQTPPVNNSLLKLILSLLAGLGLIGLVLFFFFMPKNASAVLEQKDWSRSIAVEEYQTVKESDWSLPDGGREYDKKQEIHHYDTVVDHYETVSVKHTREVQDGYDISYDYVSNGDGTYDEVEVSTPRYRTETYYEDEEQPVYVDVPVYKTKYYYEIERWIPTRSVDTQGGSDEPYWGELTLAEKEREGTRSESYQLHFTNEKGKSYTADVSQEMWEELTEGDNVKLTTQNGQVKKINDKSID